jgi:glycosyltransferase involved in cell wall biosynthesis
MTDPPLFSVLSVCYNEAAYLQECIDSVRGQSDPSWELILIDDHSSDATFEIMTAAAAADPRITALRNPVKGKVAGFNEAVDRARGRWIHLLGGDDILVSTCLMECRQLIESSPPSLVAVYHDYSIISKETGMDLGSRAYGPWLEMATVDNVIRKKLVIGGGFFAIRTEAAREALWPQPPHWTDEDQALASVLKGLGEVRYLARPLYVYRMPARHYSGNPTKESYRQGMRHFSEGMRLFKERSPRWAELPPTAIEEAERHLRHYELISKPDWTWREAWRSRLSCGQLGKALVLRHTPSLFPRLVGIHRWLWNLEIGAGGNR